MKQVRVAVKSRAVMAKVAIPKPITPLLRNQLAKLSVVAKALIKTANYSRLLLLIPI
ncbi:MAG TPA: hypothetical protein VLN09_05155 [Psychrobacter sp.]|uniref:hypothetical protein n=1 Tax=Psychrobacter sp. TaxID=56811 RepID=UPI002BE22706|nr:hypothetical protein [Psychrobacter sp.]HSP85121.1 hypothetical protein [Psychrobacter sp.]